MRGILKSAGLAALVVVLTVFLHSPSFGQTRIVSIDSSLTTIDAYSIQYDQKIRIPIRINNNTGSYHDFVHGWKITSPDGASWDSTTIDSCGPFNLDGESIFLLRFNQVAAFSATSKDGQSPDTVGILCAGTPSGTTRQLPPGYNDTAFAIIVWGLNENNAGKHLCLDSATAQDGLWDWKWVARGTFPMDYFPEWRGLPNQPYNPGMGYCFSIGPDTRLSVQQDSVDHIRSHNPVFTWGRSIGDTAQQFGFEIAVSSNDDWSIVELWNPPPFVSSDSFVTYGGAPLIDGETFWVRLRILTPNGWSYWVHRQFRMNSLPSTPVQKSPTNGRVVGSLPILWIANSYDAEGDPLSFDFEGFHDTDCVAGPDINLTGVTSGVDSTGGIVTELLAENCRYWWRVRSFDGFEYSEWSNLQSFYANGTPEPPTMPILDSPPFPDGKPIFTLLPTLTWLPSSDSDPGDTVRYKLELSFTPSFSLKFGRDSLLSPQFSLSDSLSFGTHYWWRVTAIDNSGLRTMSNVNNFWTWKLGDVNHSHGVDLSDLSLLIAYLTRTPRPEIFPKLVGDITGNCQIDLSDLSLMILYLSSAGVQFELGCE